MSKLKQKQKSKEHVSHRNLISLSMIVKNEEKFLEDCLKSVAKLVDEIIIVDTGSTDKTKQIAKKYHAKIYDFTWNNNFSDARNYSLSKVTNPWVLYLDADERLYEKYHSQIKRLINKPNTDAIVVKIRSKVSGPLGKEPHFQNYPRIFKRTKDLKFVYPVHEQILPSIIQQKYKIITTDILIEHLGYSQNEEIIYSKIDRNKKYLELQLKNDPNNAYAIYQLAQTLRLLPQKEDEALALYKKAIENANNDISIISTCYLQLASIMLKKRKLDEALSYVIQSLQTTKFQTYGWFMQAELLFLNKDYRNSLDKFQHLNQLLQIPLEQRKSELMIEKEISKEFILKRILSCMINLQDYKSAANLFKKRYENIVDWNYLWFEVASVILTTDDQINIKWENIFKSITTETKLQQDKIYISKLILQYPKWLHYSIVIKWLTSEAIKLMINENERFEYYISEALFNQGNFEESYNFINLFIHKKGYDESAFQLKGIIEIKSNKFLDAIDSYETILKYCSDKTKYFKTIGGLYAKVGEFDKAAKTILKIEKLNQ